ncbi:DUF6099 family protein [Streptomyces sp. NBC_01317]|uniref:DUF6099 family protein n=1 Tax=Streptomyces sp. NBC_01317 TaxID=2903822 RepID=UPI002E140699|nr:DUF6099 family protein [Streptomyces sp. NBC_01317]
MDAERLIGVTRRALAGSGEAWDVIAEAWQAQALAQAIGNRLALSGPPELRGEARELGETGGRGCDVPEARDLPEGREAGGGGPGFDGPRLEGPRLDGPGVGGPGAGGPGMELFGAEVRFGDGSRARQLSSVPDARGALTGLAELLGEVGIALVAVACATDEEGLYWQCIEAIDAADEASDRVAGLLRRLVAQEQERARKETRERQRQQEAERERERRRNHERGRGR